jgi:hypothetical protein
MKPLALTALVTLSLCALAACGEEARPPEGPPNIPMVDAGNLPEIPVPGDGDLGGDGDTSVGDGDLAPGDGDGDLGDGDGDVGSTDAGTIGDGDGDAVTEDAGTEEPVVDAGPVVPGRAPDPSNIPECPATAPENPVGSCIGVPIYATCGYSGYNCICDWYHWICL